MRAKITLHPGPLHSAITMRIKRDIPTPDDFEGPIFHDVREVRLDGGFLQVHLDAGDVYAYPVDSVARYALYPGDAQ